MLLKIEPLRNELKSLESEAGTSEAKVGLRSLNTVSICLLIIALYNDCETPRIKRVITRVYSENCFVRYDEILY